MEATRTLICSWNLASAYTEASRSNSSQRHHNNMTSGHPVQRQQDFTPRTNTNRFDEHSGNPFVEKVLFIHGRIPAPRSWQGIRPQYEMRGHSATVRILAPWLWVGIHPWTNTCLMFLIWYSSSSTDEYSPDAFERVFVRGRIVASWFWEGFRQSPTNTLVEVRRILWTTKRHA